MRKARSLLALGAVAMVLAAALAACDWKGPAPTQASVEAVTGPYATATVTVAAGNGFAGGTIYYPTSTAEGRFGAVVIAPGFLTTQDSTSWYGPRVASQGFVVFTIDTNSIYDNPDARATQMLTALDWLTGSSTVADRVDPARLAVMGWSMGGGGALAASLTRPSLRAAIGVAPWSGTTDWSTDTVPTLIVACQNDTIAPIAQHAVPIYNSLSASLPRGYLEIANEDHFCVTSYNANVTERTAIAREVISWLKRFVDGDTRYTQFLCPPPAVGGVVSAAASPCNY